MVAHTHELIKQQISTHTKQNSADSYVQHIFKCTVGLYWMVHGIVIWLF